MSCINHNQNEYVICFWDFSFYEKRTWSLCPQSLMRYLEDDEVYWADGHRGWHWRWRWSWPRSSSSFLVPVFLQGPSLPRPAPRRRPTKKILSALESHHRVQGRRSSVSAKILPETGNAFRNQFFLQPVKTFTTLTYLLSVYTHILLPDCLNLLFTHTMYFMCSVSIPSMGIHLLWWEPGTERSDLRNWVHRQRRPWRGWRSPRWGEGRARSRGRPGSSWCRCRSWRLASFRCWWCHSHHSPGHLMVASEYLARQTVLLKYCKPRVYLKLNHKVFIRLRVNIMVLRKKEGFKDNIFSPLMTTGTGGSSTTSASSSSCCLTSTNCPWRTSCLLRSVSG